MYKISLDQTLRAAFTLTWNNYLNFILLSVKPMILMILGFVAYFASFFLLLPVGVSPSSELSSIPVEAVNPLNIILVFGILFLTMLPMAAVVMNWQSFLLYAVQKGQGEPVTVREFKASAFMNNDVWWARFKTYLWRILQLFGLVLVAQVGFFLVVFIVASIASFLSLILMPLLFVGIIMAIPYLSRMHVAFALVASDAKDSSFSVALKLGEKQGWMLFFTYFVTLTALQIGLFIVGMIIGLLMGIALAFIPLASLIILILLSVASMVILIAVTYSLPALFLMQLDEKFHDGWEKIAGFKPFEIPKAGTR